jgi:hypothetical protein
VASIGTRDGVASMVTGDHSLMSDLTQEFGGSR